MKNCCFIGQTLQNCVCGHLEEKFVKVTCLHTKKVISRNFAGESGFLIFQHTVDMIQLYKFCKFAYFRNIFWTARKMIAEEREWQTLFNEDLNISCFPCSNSNLGAFQSKPVLPTQTQI